MWLFYTHLFKLLFHIRNECKLRAASVKIVRRTADAEVGVALDIISKEAKSALKRHHYSAYGQKLYLAIRKAAVAAAKEALGVSVVEIEIKRDLGEICLVLCGGICTEADRVAEVVYRVSGHNSIKIYHAHGQIGVGIKENVVELGVVVGNAERKSALGVRYLE